MRMLGLICWLFTSLAWSEGVKVTPPLYNYFVVEVINSETAFSPVAEYRYEVSMLTSLNDKSATFPHQFAVGTVLQHDTPAPGYLMLVRESVKGGNISVVDVTTKEHGFSDSDFFLGVFFDKLEAALSPVVINVADGYRPVRVSASMLVANDHSVQVRYNRPHNNFALIAVDYYVAKLIEDFSPYFQKNAQINFSVAMLPSGAIIRREKYVHANLFFDQAVESSFQ